MTSAPVAAPVEPVAPDAPVPPGGVLNRLRGWLGRYICTVTDAGRPAPPSHDHQPGTRSAE